MERRPLRPPAISREPGARSGRRSTGRETVAAASTAYRQGVFVPRRHSVSVERKRIAAGACVAAADRYLNECFNAGTPPHVNEFAAECGLSPRSLGRIFMTEAGVSVARYFKDARLQRARDLLVSSDLSVTAIAHAAGFGTRITFFRAFKRATGVSPEQYRAISTLPASLPKM